MVDKWACLCASRLTSRDRWQAGLGPHALCQPLGSAIAGSLLTDMQVGPCMMASSQTGKWGQKSNTCSTAHLLQQGTLGVICTKIPSAPRLYPTRRSTFPNALVRVVQRSRTNGMYINRKRLIIWTWLTQLQRLANPKICSVSPRTEDPGEPMVQFPFKSKSLRTRRADVSGLAWRLTGSRLRKSQCSNVWFWIWSQEMFPLTRRRVRLFVLVRPSTDWMRPPTLERAICFTQSTPSNVHLI